MKQIFLPGLPAGLGPFYRLRAVAPLKQYILYSRWLLDWTFYRLRAVAPLKRGCQSHLTFRAQDFLPSSGGSSIEASETLFPDPIVAFFLPSSGGSSIEAISAGVLLIRHVIFLPSSGGSSIEAWPGGLLLFETEQPFYRLRAVAPLKPVISEKIREAADLSTVFGR